MVVDLSCVCDGCRMRNVADLPHRPDSDGVIDLTRSESNADPELPIRDRVEPDRITALANARGEEYVAAAAELGLVVTEKGTFADPDHPARTYVTVDQAETQLRARFAQHGVDWTPDAQTA